MSSLLPHLKGYRVGTSLGVLSHPTLLQKLNAEGKQLYVVELKGCVSTLGGVGSAGPVGYGARRSMSIAD